MNKQLTVKQLQMFAMLEGDHIIGDEATTIVIKTTGIKVYTTARHVRNGFNV
jgi:hypothetical protein